MPKPALWMVVVTASSGAIGNAARGSARRYGGIWRQIKAKIRREADLLTDREFAALEPKEKIFKVTDREVETLKQGTVDVPQFP